MSYVDDTFIPIIAPAPTLLEKASRAMKATDTAFRRHGFRLNFSPGKTEVVIATSGPGANELRKQIAHAKNCRLDFTDGAGQHRSVMCVSSYKHLGARKAATDTMAAEIRARCGAVAAAGGKLRKKVLSNDALREETKANITKAYLLSRALYNAGVWPTLFSAEAGRIHTAVMKLARAIAASARRKEKVKELATEAAGTTGAAATADAQQADGARIDKGAEEVKHEWLSDQAVHESTRIPAPAVMISRLRVLLLIRVLTQAPWSLRVAISAAAPAPRSWVKAVSHDLEWFATATEELKGWRGKSFHERCSHIARNPKETRKLLNAAIANVENSRKERWATTRTLRQLGERHACSVCAALFDSKQAAAVHEYRQHGKISDIKAKVSSHHCVACMQYFGSYERVICHLREKATRCLASYIADVPDLDAETAKEINEASLEESRACVQAGRKRHFACAPAIRLHGPLTRTATLSGICHARLLRDGKRGRSVQDVLDAIGAA